MGNLFRLSLFAPTDHQSSTCVPGADALRTAVLLTVPVADCSALSTNAPHAFEASFVAVKHHLMPYCVCRATGQTGVTGDKGQTGDAGAFDKDMLLIRFFIETYCSFWNIKWAIYFVSHYLRQRTTRAPHACQELTHYGQCFWVRVHTVILIFHL